jgi:hypothetical protein
MLARGGVRSGELSRPSGGGGAVIGAARGGAGRAGDAMEGWLPEPVVRMEGMLPDELRGGPPGEDGRMDG